MEALSGFERLGISSVSPRFALDRSIEIVQGTVDMDRASS